MHIWIVVLRLRHYKRSLHMHRGFDDNNKCSKKEERSVNCSCAQWLKTQISTTNLLCLVAHALKCIKVLMTYIGSLGVCERACNMFCSFTNGINGITFDETHNVCSSTSHACSWQCHLKIILLSAVPWIIYSLPQDWKRITRPYMFNTLAHGQSTLWFFGQHWHVLVSQKSSSSSFELDLR